MNMIFLCAILSILQIYSRDTHLLNSENYALNLIPWSIYKDSFFELKPRYNSGRKFDLNSSQIINLLKIA